MEVLFFCPRWGHADLSWEQLAIKAKSAGYHGIETDIPMDVTGKEEMISAFRKHKLFFVAQHWETVSADFEEHKNKYRECLINMVSAKPLFINSQTGRDFFTAAQNDELIAMAAEIASNEGIAVYHETHRGKFSFAAHVTEAFIKRNPELELTLDISHWINVAETFLEDQENAVEQAIRRTRHVHARVGHPQGPQVTDPRIDQWKNALQIHLGFWDRVIENCREQGYERISFAPEFGPVPYMSLDLATGKPVTDQWEVNKFMMDLLKKRYSV